MSTGGLYVRYGRHWWPTTGFDKAAYTIACPACPLDVHTLNRLPETNAAILAVLLSGIIYAIVCMLLEMARRMRRNLFRPDF